MKYLRCSVTNVVAIAISLIVLLHVPAVSEESSPGTTIEFHNGSVFRCAGIEEARVFLGTADDWVRAFGPFDRALRLQSLEPVTEEEFLQFAAGEARDWDADEIAKVTDVIAVVAEKLDALDMQLDLPEEIVLIQTTGAEEGNAGGYTRVSAIIVPEGQMALSVEHLQGFVLHELFHVMTRHNPDIRVPLYDIIGFRPCDEIEYPRELLARKITNPDAFHFNTCIELAVGDDPVLVMPLTLAKSDTYKGGALFANVSVEFLMLDPEDMTPAYVDGEPVLYTMGELTGFFDKVGKNTMYIVHAEEIMADNFSMAVRGQREVANPEILDAITEILKRKDG